MHLSVIIPAYNEAKRLDLNPIYNYLKSQDYDWEIIFISDGSKDETVSFTSSFAENHPGVKIIDNPENHGKGFVVRQGMMAARGNFRLFTDADNSTSIEQVEKFWPFLCKTDHQKDCYDIVIGSIGIAGAEIIEEAGILRRFFGRYSKYLIRLVAGLWEIRDTQRGFKCFTAKAAGDIFPRTEIDRWGFDIEVLSLAKRLGYKIKEVPVRWENPPESKVNWKSYFATLWDLIKIRFNLWFNTYGVKN